MTDSDQVGDDPGGVVDHEVDDPDEEMISVAEIVAEVAGPLGLDADEQAHVLALAKFMNLGLAMLAGVLEEAAPEGEAAEQAAVVEAMAAFSEAFAEHGRDLAQSPVSIARPLVADALVRACRTVATDEPDAALGLLMLARAMEPLASYEMRAAVAWLMGRSAELAGDALGAEEHFAQALSDDPKWIPALLSMAAVANDRGDAERGLALLDRAGMDPDDGLYRLLTTYRSVGSLGRNDPCWCGSGRKLKQCHREQQALPLHVRAGWLYHKASAYLQDGPWRLEIIELARLRSAHWVGERAILDALDDPLVMSSMLFEGEVLFDYFDDRGVLLPEDEAELCESWLECERSVFEVEEVQPEVGMRVRDLRDGSSCFVHERIGSRQAYPGMIFATLLLPVGDGRHGFFGGIEPLGLHERSEAIAIFDSEPDPDLVVQFLSRRFSPPRLQTTTGEELCPCETVLRIRGRASISRVLDGRFMAEGEGSWLAGTDGEALQEGQTIGAQLILTGRRLRISTLSVERMEMMLAAIADLGLDYEVISQERQDPGRMLGATGDQGLQSGLPIELDDPMLIEALEGHVRQYEEGWLDQSIPALDGWTPRDAVADPTRRADVIALLNSFPPKVPGSMDPERLRMMLGL